MATEQQSGDYVDIPGYADVLRKEAEIRRAAFAPPKRHVIGGIPVRALTLALLLELEAARVAFVNPWKFDTGMELAAECARFIWHISEVRHHTGGFWSKRRGWRIRDRVIAQVAKHPETLTDLRAYLDEALYDAPFETASDQAVPSVPFSHWAAGVIDMLAAGKYPFTEDQVMAMPLARVWQYYRRARARVTDLPALNPSDAWAAHEIDKINQAARAAVAS